MKDPRSDDLQPGLSRRVTREARRISGQHRQLDVFYEQVLRSLSASDVSRAQSEFLRFRDALDAHFTVEEQIHFPALHGLKPGLDAELVELVEEHRVFRRTLEALADSMDRGELEECSEALDQFVVALASHEGREEKMAERIREPD